MRLSPLLVLLSLSILAGCNSRAADPQTSEKISNEPRGEFRSRSYTLSEREHVVIFDMPGTILPMRCWALIDDKTNTSNMHCDDSLDEKLPAQGQELER